MAAAGVLAFGSTITIGGTTPAEITDISGPDISTDSIDTTHMLSTGRWAEHLAGVIEGGAITVSCNYNPAPTETTLTAIWAMIGTEKAIVITHNTATSATDFSFDATVDGITFGAPVRDKLSLVYKLGVTGKITRAA